MADDAVRQPQDETIALTQNAICSPSDVVTCEQCTGCGWHAIDWSVAFARFIQCFVSLPNIESELSYAYLHAVASTAGMSCRQAGRHEDNNGIDAGVTAWAPFENGGYLTEVDMKVQLKATVGIPPDDGTHLSYFLKGVNRYDDLRADTVNIARLLVVLFLPEDAANWLGQTEDELALRRCGYWVSLRGGAATNNATGATVYLPKAQVFTPAALRQLASRLSRQDLPVYQAP